MLTCNVGKVNTIGIIHCANSCHEFLVCAHHGPEYWSDCGVRHSWASPSSGQENRTGVLCAKYVLWKKTVQEKEAEKDVMGSIRVRVSLKGASDLRDQREKYSGLGMNEGASSDTEGACRVWEAARRPGRLELTQQSRGQWWTWADREAGFDGRLPSLPLTSLPSLLNHLLFSWAGPPFPLPPLCRDLRTLWARPLSSICFMHPRCKHFRLRGR